MARQTNLYEVLIRFDHMTGAYKGAHCQYWVHDPEDKRSPGYQTDAIPIANLKELDGILGVGVRQITGDLDTALARVAELEETLEKIREERDSALAISTRYSTVIEQQAFDLAAFRRGAQADAVDAELEVSS